MGAVESESRRMKLAAFKDLCDREWAKDQHGDVQALHLTNSSLLELTCDVLLSGSSEPFLFPIEQRVSSEDIKDIRAGAVCRDISNPVTRSVVHISGDSDRDFAEVYSVPGGVAQVTIPPTLPRSWLNWPRSLRSSARRQTICAARSRRRGMPACRGGRSRTRSAPATITCTASSGTDRLSSSSSRGRTRLTRR